MYDTIIVGAGLAGACTGLYLSRQESVLVIDAGDPASGASGIAAGLVNPLSGLRAKPVWRMEESLAAFHEVLAAANAQALFDGRGVLRPAEREDDAPWFEEATRRHPAHARWLTAGEVAKRFPDVHAPLGAAFLPTSGAVAVPLLVEAFLRTAAGHGASVRTHQTLDGWEETRDAATVTCTDRTTGRRESLTAKRIVLALGQGYAAFPVLARLRLHSVKGQVVRVRPARGVPAALPHLAGRGYIVCQPDTLVVGSTYEHAFADHRPDPHQTARLLQNARSMLPALRLEEVVEAQAGIRVSVPGIRLPMVGPVPGHDRVWLFTGLGSKGLLMAPLLARELLSYFATPGRVPGEVRIRPA